MRDVQQSRMPPDSDELDTGSDVSVVVLQFGVYLFFAGWVAIMTAFVNFFLPETKVTAAFHFHASIIAQQCCRFCSRQP